MKICIISDSHNKVNINEFLISVKADFVIHLGDLNDYSRKEFPIFFVNGNKENFKDMEYSINNKFNNLVHLNTGEIKKTLDFTSKKYVSFIGINGIVAKQVWNKSINITDLDGLKRNLKHNYNKYIFREQLEQIKNIKQKIDIIFSHDIPYSNKKKEKLFGNVFLSSVLCKLKPKFWIHGHAHKPDIHCINGTTIISVPPLYDRYCELTIKGDEYSAIFKKTDTKFIKGDTNDS